MLRVALVMLLAAAPLVGSAVLPGGSAHAQQREFAVDITKEIVNAETGELRPTQVRVSQTVNLFDRQQISVELAGFMPTWSATRTENTGVSMEYPVVVMQCRGADPTPQTCLNERRSVWYPGYDAAAPADLADRARQLTSPGSHIGFPGDTFAEQKANALRAEQLSFDAADGISYLWESTLDPETGEPVIDEATLKSYPPPDTSSAGASVLATRSIPIRPDGGYEFVFEVRQRNSQASLGCTDTAACSLVIVPIMDMACAPDAPADCGGPPKGAPPGEPGGTHVNNFLGPRTWFAASNWTNRYVVPLEFAPDPATCSVFDERPVAAVYGSELIDVAQQRWGAAYCAGARPADYLPVYTQGSEYEARRQFTSRLGPRYQQDAVVTTQPVTGSPRPVVHAPSGLTGFTVAFSMDDASGRQVYELTLSPRLLAKLITQSYSPGAVTDSIRRDRTFYTDQPITSDADARQYYWEHPDIALNPRNIFHDQEFLALNPDLALADEDGRRAPQFGLLAYSAPVIFQIQSDIVVDLTRYVTSDPAARAWLDGAPDEQGMVVNPAWRGVGEFELYSLRDTVVRPQRPRKSGWYETAAANLNYFTLVGAGDECSDALRTPMMTRFANITNSAEAAAIAQLDRRGSATPTCTVNKYPVPPEEQVPPQFPGDDPAQNVVYAETKAAPADFGQRAMLSVTTVAHARFYGLPTARLVNASGTAVAPDPGTMLNALAAARQDPVTGTIAIDHRLVDGAAYPGTMVAFTAAPTSGLDPAAADNYADFIEFMATDGQDVGDPVTGLPSGYDPLTPAMRQQALDAARAVREQRGEVPPPPPGGPLGGGMPDGFGGPNAQQAPVTAPNGAVSPQGAGATESEEDDPKAVARTDGSDSWLSRWALPLLLGFGLLAALAAGAVQLASRPDHPVRRALRAVVRR